MPKWFVYYTETVSHEVEVEADTAEDAFELVRYKGLVDKPNAKIINDAAYESVVKDDSYEVCDDADYSETFYN